MVNLYIVHFHYPQISYALPTIHREKTAKFCFGGKPHSKHTRIHISEKFAEMSLQSVFTSPKREGGFILSAENLGASPPFAPCSWSEGKGEEFSPGQATPDLLERLRRGRPRQDSISTLVIQGAQTDHAIRCNICKRVFPREKSLQAHRRTHTGKKICVF